MVYIDRAVAEKAFGITGVDAYLDLHRPSHAAGTGRKS